MTQSEKLEALIQKAIDGGFEGISKRWQVINIDTPGTLLPPFEINATYPMIVEKIENVAPLWENYYHDLEWLLFNHDFAKALFGDVETKHHYGGHVEFYDFGGKDYQFHLMVAAISEDPIDYMHSAVFGDKR